MNVHWMECKILVKQIRCRSVCVNTRTQTHTQDRWAHEADIGISKPRRQRDQPVRRSRCYPRSRWAARTCGSSCWTPTDRLPGSGSCRSATCCSPSASCWTDTAPPLPCCRGCVWTRWWSCGPWWPPCSPRGWSSGGFPPGFRRDWASTRSSWEAGLRWPAACLRARGGHCEAF